MNVDNRFVELYKGRIRQVFVYITSKCQLRCRQCLYKPLLSNNSADIDYAVLQELLELFAGWGAYKVSFLGGEPTLYHDRRTGARFPDVLKKCDEIGYKYIRFDTNGQFSSEYLEQEFLRCTNEITFSLDGFDARSNDVVRGAGSFEKCISNIKAAARRGFKVQITMCVHKEICPSAKDGIENMERMISFASCLGASSINFHPILKAGIARDQWIDSTNILPETWMELYEIIRRRNAEHRYPIKVRLPMRFVKKNIYDKNPEQYNYCPLRMAERALVMPDGTIKSCAFTIGTPYHTAEYGMTGIKSYMGEYSEASAIGNGQNGEIGCCFQSITSDQIQPLCMSFKPHQDEIVWRDLMPGG